MPTASIARGALIGALVGDAAGATLEFLGRKPAAAEVERALGMVGGGCWRVAPGQITDDGELALSLARALAGEASFNRDKVAGAYVEWFNSHPFDVGNATRAAFGSFGRDARITAPIVEQAARRANMESKANGALMRSIGLGIWSWRVSPEAAAEAARADARLSHTNPACQHANAAYVAAVRRLVLKPGDGDGAVDAAKAALSDGSASEVRGWIEEAELGHGPAYQPMDGFVRIGFTHAFRHLVAKTPYVEALRETLAGGGDTDTNACIVGGLIGALHGEGGVPEPMRRAVLACDSNDGRPRPDLYSTRDALSLAERLAQ